METTFPPVNWTACASDEPDDRIVERVLRGDTEAMEVLAARYRGRLYAFGFAMLRNRDDAEDLAQECLVRAIGELPRYRCRGQFRAWLYRIAGNLCRDRARKASRRDVVLAEHHAEIADPRPYGDPEGTVVRTVVLDALRDLSHKYREPVVLHYMEGFSISETATLLGRTETAVRVQLWRARHQLARLLQDSQTEVE